MATKKASSTKSKKPAQTAKKPAPVAKAAVAKKQPVKPPVALSGTKPDKDSQPAVSEKGKKSAPKKQKTIRDSFNMPAGDYELIGQMKKRAIALGREIKKSELLRAGVKALAAMKEAAFAEAVAAVAAIKTGRPAKKRK